jgi:hypothetical protein
MTKILKPQDLKDLVIGAPALTTGGGGVAPPMEIVDEMVEDLTEKGGTCKLIQPNEIPDKSTILYGCGAGGGINLQMRENWGGWGKDYLWEIEQKQKLFPLNSWSKLPINNTRDTAKKMLMELIGEKKPYANLLFEVAPYLNRLCNAALSGDLIIDADTTGYRSEPEMAISTLNLYDVPICPAVLATSYGDIITYQNLLNWQRFEDLNRTIANASGGGVGGLFAIEGKHVKKSVVPGSTTFIIKVGKAIREAREKNDDPVEALLDVIKGYKLFEGKIVSYLREERGGYWWGQSRFKGINDFEGHSFRIWYKECNQISWKDEKMFVTCPDPIDVVDNRTGEGLSNITPEVWGIGKEVSVIGRKSIDAWRSEKGLKIAGPTHFNFWSPYIPIEEIIK